MTPQWFTDSLLAHATMTHEDEAYRKALEKYVLAVAPGYLAMYADPDYYRPKVEDIVEYAEALMREVLERSKP